MTSPHEPGRNAPIGEIIAARFSRRGVLAGALAGAAIPALFGADLVKAAKPAGRFRFQEIERGVDETHHVAKGHRADILIRWGDPVVAGAPPFDPLNQSGAAQDQQFGYNCDYIGFIPLSASRALLCVNHEYTIPWLMFPGVWTPGADGPDQSAYTADMAEVEKAAHGVSIVELERKGGRWTQVKDSPYGRRVSMRSTPIRMSGPAAGHARVKTNADPEGLTVIGTLNNCAGGVTPWGTYLTGEENFNGYFLGDFSELAEARNYFRYGVGSGRNQWGRFDPRFNLASEPNEPNRFGWIVEIDPTDPKSAPKKRTALGRFKHEGAETVVNADGRVVIYSGDDERGEYLYRFVTAGKFDPKNRSANADLLDAGVLSVARFDADGTMAWLPLIHGQGPLTAENGFESQADVLIEARHAAELLGATPMDRPEDVQPAPGGKVYVMLTNNESRMADDLNPANPRGPNPFGHIVELLAPGGDHAADKMGWDILVRCGDPSIARVGALWNPATSKNGWFASPDNCAVDSRGRLWIATDQGSRWDMTGSADGLWGLETQGALRGTGKMFFRVPVGAELCGPCFTPDARSLFLSIQHPAADGSRNWEPFARASVFADPATRWPDFKPDMPPRPSVVQISRTNGGVIGG